MDSDSGLTGSVRRRCRVVASCMKQCNMPLLVGLVIVTLTLVFTTSRYMLFEDLDQFPIWLPDAINMALMSVAIAVITLLCVRLCRADRRRMSSRGRPSISCSSRLVALEWCERVAAVVFVLGSIIFHSIRAHADVECQSEWEACQDGNIRWYRQCETVHNFIQLTFMVVMCALCLFFKVGTGQGNVWMLFGLGVAQCGNFSMWFNAVLEESEILPHAHNSTFELEKCRVFFDVKTFNTSALARCFKRSTPGYVLEREANPYVYPFNIEFLLLAIKIIFDFLLDEHHGGPRDDDLGASDDADTGDVADIEVDNGSMRCCVRYPAVCIFWTIFYVAFSFIINAGFLCLGIQEFHAAETESAARDTFAKFRLAYWIILFLVALGGIGLVYAGHKCTGSGGYRNLQILEDDDVSLSDDPPTSSAAGAAVAGTNLQHLVRFEYFVVLCSVGPLAHIFFTMIANLQTSHDVSPTHLFLADEILNIIQILSQTAFYIYAAKAESVTERCENQRVKGLIKAVFFVFFVSNLSLWAEDSFVEAHHKDKFFQHAYFKHWTVIYNVTNPVMLSFRINSMFLFGSLYFRLWACQRQRNSATETC